MKYWGKVGAFWGGFWGFIQFGPNTTTFVLPSEVFPVSVRTTGHGISAGIGKLGAFIGVFLVPQLQNGVGLRGMLVVAGVAAIGGCLLTMTLPEPAQRSLDEMHPNPSATSTPTVAVATAPVTVVTPHVSPVAGTTTNSESPSIVVETPPAN